MSVFRLSVSVVLMAMVPLLAVANEYKVGESVMVSVTSAKILSKQGELGSVPHGTQFKVRQTNRGWLLGDFNVNGRKILGWVKPSEVARGEADISQAPAHDFNWHNLLLATIKLNPGFDMETHIDAYMQAARPEVYKRFRNDEFEFHDKRRETLGILKQHVANFDLGRDFILRADLTLGKYNFASEHFPVKEANDNYSWYRQKGVDAPLPHRIKMSVAGSGVWQTIPMPKEQAQSFLASRKDRWGDISRRVYANIRCRVTSLKTTNELVAEARWVQFFADEARTRLLYETPKSPTEQTLPPDVNVDSAVAANVVEDGLGVTSSISPLTPADVAKATAIVGNPIFPK